MAMTPRIFALFAVSCLTLTAPLAARPIDADWTEVARAQEGDCALIVTGNGRFYRIEASGLGSGEAARYRIENGTMRPIDWAVRADGSGSFARYYLPYRENHGDSLVTVVLSSQQCDLAASFEFQTPGITVH